MPRFLGGTRPPRLSSDGPARIKSRRCAHRCNPVKTTISAGRTRGRGTEKVPHHLEFPLGHAAVERASPKLIFCFVDLRGDQPDIPPDVYVVPASEILDYYKGWNNIRQFSYFRHHPEIKRMEPFKNNWAPIIESLS